MNGNPSQQRPLHSPHAQAAFSPRSSPRFSSNRNSDTRTSQQVSSSALADHVPNIQLGGPKGRTSTGSANDVTTPRELLPATTISHSRSAGTSASERLSAQQQQWASSMVSPRGPHGPQGSNSSARAARASASASSNRTASSSAPDSLPPSPRPAPTMTARPTVITTTAGRSPRLGTASRTTAVSAAQEPPQTLKRTEPRSKEEVGSTASGEPALASPRNAVTMKSIRHPYSLRPEAQSSKPADKREKVWEAESEDALVTEKENAPPTKISDRRERPRPPPTVPDESQPSLTERSQPRRSATPDDAFVEEPPKTARAAVAAATATTPRSSSSSSFVSVSAMKPARRTATAAATSVGSERASAAGSRERHPQKQREEAEAEAEDTDPGSEFFRFQYYYYPDANRALQEKEEGEGGGADLNSSLPRLDGKGSHHSMNNSSMCKGEDVSELNDTLQTPPIEKLVYGPADEAPFSPRGMPPSPYMQRLAEVTAGGALGGNSSCSRSSLVSHRVSATAGNPSSVSHRRGPTPSNRSPLSSAFFLDSRFTDRAREDGNDEATAAERVRLQKQIALTRERLATVTHNLEAFTKVVDFRMNEKAVLEHERSEAQQQAESLQARAADVMSVAKEMETKHHTDEELAMLQVMLEEREQRLEAMEAKRDALAGLWAQLQFLHEEAEAQEAQRRDARRRQRCQMPTGAEELDATPDAVEENDGRESSVPLSESEREIKRSMKRVSRAKTAVFGDDSPLGPPRESGVDESTLSDNAEDGDWVEDEPEVRAPLPSGSPPRRLGRGQASMSMSPSSARGMSIISAGTADVLQNFLSELYSEMDALAMICIQKPSPPAAVSHCSRANRCIGAGGASAWSRDINTGNNGFFSFFGGATEAHLSAKPLSTFLTCASRLTRSAWRMEAEVQLRARELATEEDEDELRRRLEGKPAYEPAPIVELFSDDDEECQEDKEKNCEANRQDTTAVTVGDETPPPKSGLPSKALFASPELLLSAGKRRASINDSDTQTNSSTSPTPTSSPVTSTTAAMTAFTPAPQIFLPSLAYAAPRLPMISRQLDDEQLTLQRGYEQEVERQRTRRRCLVKTLKETYRNHVEPQLRQRLQAERARQEALARELVALGVAEVTMQWEEYDGEDDADSTNDCHLSGEEQEGSPAPWGRRAAAARSRGASVNGGALGEPHNRSRAAAAISKGPAKYLRQVIVRALQVTEIPEAGEGSSSTSRTAAAATAHSSSYRRRQSSSASVSAENLLQDAFGLPMVSSTRHRLLADPASSPSHGNHTPRPMRDADGMGEGGHKAPSPGVASARTPRLVTMASSSPLKTVTPMTPSPMKSKPAALDAAPRSGRGAGSRSLHTSHPTSRDSDVCFSSLYTEETRERLDAAGRPIRAAAVGEAHSRGGNRIPATPPTVNLLGVNPAESPGVLDSGAVKVSLLYFGDEARRRQRIEAQKDQHMREFWALREELARADEANFVLASRLHELEESYKAQRCRRAMSMQEAMEKLSTMKQYHITVHQEKEEWEEVLSELQAAKDAMMREKEASSNRHRQHRQGK